MTHASLFSGLGGFEVAAEAMGWTNIFNCDINPFCRIILKNKWPGTETYEDISEFSATKFNGYVDVLSGGFPCQPFSLAGIQSGTADHRFLWPQMLRIIREVQPCYIVAENVIGILNVQNGLAFQMVCTDLEANDYTVQPFILPAAGVGAPHRRYRVWFIAKKNSGSLRNANTGKATHHRNSPSPTNPMWPRLEGAASQILPWEDRGLTRNNQIRGWTNWPLEHPIHSGNDGLPSGMDITAAQWRKQSIIALGNAIVPMIALQIFKAIVEIEKYSLT